MIPNVIHFVFGLKENFGDKPFSLIHYLAIRSAYECNKPDAIKFHYKYEPTGEWWDKIKPYLTLVKVEPPKEIFGNPLLHYAHQADVLRLEILLKEGGIYLDMDVLCLNSFEPLRRRHAFVMGREEERGLCNAVILAEPGAEFLKKWYAQYISFRSQGRDQFWFEHSVTVPAQLAQKFPELIHIEDKYSFFWPYYQGSPITLWERATDGAQDELMVQLKKEFVFHFLSTSFCIHLWEQLWWEDYLKYVTFDNLMTSSNNFSRLARGVLNPTGHIMKKIFQCLRPLCKALISIYLPKTDVIKEVSEPQKKPLKIAPFESTLIPGSAISDQ